MYRASPELVDDTMSMTLNDAAITMQDIFETLITTAAKAVDPETKALARRSYSRAATLRRDILEMAAAEAEGLLI